MNCKSLCSECLAPDIQSASQLVTCCAFGVIVQNSPPAPLFTLFKGFPPIRVGMHPLVRCNAFSWMKVFVMQDASFPQTKVDHGRWRSALWKQCGCPAEQGDYWKSLCVCSELCQAVFKGFGGVQGWEDDFQHHLQDGQP